ncbi:MAG: protein phosphatase 2C domain-containing protein [Pseudomonadales bacterium]|jgi:protein phosphatase|nr:protein phosphatase 2C domain-containing protein [Pseudomonadales bacterium]
MKMTSRTHRGLVRLRNEDAVWFDIDLGVAVLADGMGGLMGGQMASAVAIDSFKEYFCATSAHSQKNISNAIVEADASVRRQSELLEMNAQMGTTVVLWCLIDSSWLVAHVGDSRLYHLNGGKLLQMTQDHSLARRMLDSGEVEEGVDVHKHYGHVLTQGLGLNTALAPSIHQGDPLTGRYLLCSDGLSDQLEHEHMQRIMLESDLEVCADELLQCSLEAGGKDNVSLILIEV